MEYLATTFSPMMMERHGLATVTEIKISKVPPVKDLKSAVGHEVTAKILSALLKQDVPFNRMNVTLKTGDVLYAVIPAFRSTEAREFTHEEVAQATFRCFVVEGL